MKVAKKISRDTDGEKISRLPSEVKIPDNIEDDDVADWLSDEYGFCIYNFELVG